MENAVKTRNSILATAQGLAKNNPEGKVEIAFGTTSGDPKVYPATALPQVPIIFEEIGEPSSSEYAVLLDGKPLRRGTIVFKEPPPEMQNQVATSDNGASRAIELMAKNLSTMTEKAIDQVVKATEMRITLMQEGFRQQIDAQNAHHKNLMESQKAFFDQSLTLALEKQKVELAGDSVDYIGIAEAITELVPKVITDAVDVYTQIQKARAAAGGQPQ